MSKIYKDFNDWFSTSKAHGFSSASREDAKAIWDDIEPTINASQDDYRRAFLQLAKEQAEQRSEMVDAMLKYTKTHKQPGQPTFWSWWMDQK